jgi:hypothetical protein
VEYSNYNPDMWFLAEPNTKPVLHNVSGYITYTLCLQVGSYPGLRQNCPKHTNLTILLIYYAYIYYIINYK